MKKINVYDFDHTIYRGDCMFDFYFFCIKRKPILLLYFPHQCWHALLFIVRVEERTRLKSNFFIFLKGIENIDATVNAFWKEYGDRIKHWYVKQKKSSDVIVTASPDFLVNPVLQTLNIHNLIATNMDPKTGKIKGKNCRGIEKLRRLTNEFPGVTINKMYSDSLSDLPLFEIADEPVVISGNTPLPLRSYLNMGTIKRQLLKINRIL